MIPSSSTYIQTKKTKNTSSYIFHPCQHLTISLTTIHHLTQTPWLSFHFFTTDVQYPSFLSIFKLFTSVLPCLPQIYLFCLWSCISMIASDFHIFFCIYIFYVLFFIIYLFIYQSFFSILFFSFFTFSSIIYLIIFFVYLLSDLSTVTFSKQK